MSRKVSADVAVTIPAAARVLTALAREYVRASGRSPRGVVVSARQLRYCAELLGLFAGRVVQRGESRLLSPLDVGVVGTYWVAQFAGVSQRQVWAGLFYLLGPIRDALEHPGRRLSLQILSGRASVVPDRDTAPEAIVIELFELQAHIDRLLAEHRACQSWEWVRWRKTPAEEIRVSG